MTKTGLFAPAVVASCALLLVVLLYPWLPLHVLPHLPRANAQSPCVGVHLSRGADIAAEVIAHPPNTTFCLKAGVYRIAAPIVSKSGDTFIGEPGTVINGSVLVTSWARQGQDWVAFVQTPPHPEPHGYCKPAFPGCRYANDLFVNDQPLQRVFALDQLGPGRFYFDEATRGVYIRDDPSGHTIELAASVGGFLGWLGTNNVTIRGLIIEKVANRAQLGAVESRNGDGWIIEDNEVRLNHGVGICAGSNSTVRRNFVHHNGQLGMCGVGNDILIEDNEIAFNNTAGFNEAWEAGGAKWVLTNRLTVRNNRSYDNKGPGLWTDIDNIHTRYEGNTVENNDGAGIFHEISYDAVIRNNLVVGNGHGFKVWLWGAGILVAGSPNVEVYGNTVTSNGNGIALIQQDRGSGKYGPRELGQVSVHDNKITMPEGYTGLVQDVNDRSYFISRNIRFARNTYYLNPSLRQFAWDNKALTKDEWRTYGQDPDGSFFILQ